MKRAHAAYEALAGAILLGEASAADREAYAAHAATCAQCERDIEATGTLVSSAFAAAHHSETWRPFVRDEIDARIARRRSLSMRRITTLLSAAVAGTLALNVALAIGIGPHAHRLAQPAAPPLSAAAQPLAATSVAQPVKVAAVGSLQHPGGVEPARRAVPARKHSAARARPESVLTVDPAQASAQQGPALPAILVTLPLSSEPLERGRR